MGNRLDGGLAPKTQGNVDKIAEAIELAFLCVFFSF